MTINFSEYSIVKDGNRENDKEFIVHTDSETGEIIRFPLIMPEQFRQVFRALLLEKNGAPQ